MAADNDDRGPAPDPWDEIVAEGLGETSFRFEDEPAGSDSAAEAMTGDPGDPVPDADETAASPAAEGDPVEDWLSDGDAGSEAVPPLSVFSPEDAAAGSSAIDIATGSSGIALHGEAGQEEIGSDAFAGQPAADEANADESNAGEWPSVGEAAGTDNAAGGFPDVAAAATGAVVATTVVKQPSRPAKKAGGGIGQMIGVMLGGAMAIPITLAILIYGLGKDPFGVAKMVPREAAFLLPQKFRPGFKKGAVSDTSGPRRSPLDDLPTVAEPPGDERVADDPMPEEPPIDDLAASTPEPVEPVDEAPEPAPATDLGAAPMPADSAPSPDAVAVAAPNLEALGDFGGPIAPAAAATEPPPLDTAALDEAVAEAAALGAALGAVDDRENRAYKLLRTRWYRSLARVAEELVAVENAAATSGRPLAGAPDNVSALHGGMAARGLLATELAALAPDWLAYAKRGSDGVVLPVTFESARRVGPYWSARVTLTGIDGDPRALTVISRGEPAAIAGDRLVVTGVALEGAVIWAADVRGAAAVEPPGDF